MFVFIVFVFVAFGRAGVQFGLSGGGHSGAAGLAIVNSLQIGAAHGGNTFLSGSNRIFVATGVE